MIYKAGDFLQVGTKTVRLNADTAEIANAAASDAVTPYEQVRLMIGTLPIEAGTPIPPAMDFEKIRLAFLEINTHTEFGDCDACGKRVIADDLTFVAYGEGNSGGDGSFCDECRGV